MENKESVANTNISEILQKVFAPENSNVKEAIGRTKSLISKLKRQKGNAYTDFKAQIDKKIELGTLERLTTERAKEVLAGPHHCTYPGVVMSETLTSTEIRGINDTNTNVPGSATTYALENVCPSNPIGNSFNVQTHFSLNKFPYSSNVSKAYLRILVDDVTKNLRVFIWYDEEDVEMKNPVFYLRTLVTVWRLQS